MCFWLFGRIKPNYCLLISFMNVGEMKVTTVVLIENSVSPFHWYKFGLISITNFLNVTI